MTAQLTLGLSSGLFPALRPADWALCQSAGVEALEIGYEHALPALEDARCAQELEDWPGKALFASLHAPYRPGRDLSLLDGDARQEALARTAEALALARRLGACQVVVHASQEPIVPGARDARLQAPPAAA